MLGKNQGKGPGIWLLLNDTNGLPPDPPSFSFLHVLPSTGYILSFDNRHSNRCEVIAPCGLDLHFSNDQLNSAHFNMSRGHLNVFSGGGKSLFGSFAHFLIGLLASCSWIMSVVYTFWILTSPQMCGFPVFSSSPCVVFLLCWLFCRSFLVYVVWLT